MHPHMVLAIDNDPSSSWSANASLANQLEHTKEDLEQMAYAVSHDLKAPLRAISFACEALHRNTDVCGNYDAQAPLRTIANESVRMKTLMDGLLEYLNLETFTPNHSRISSHEIVETALAVVQKKIDLTGAKIICEKLPDVYGHRGRLTRLFANLLDNALKFRGAATQVRIGTRPAEKRDFVEFYVEDNGIGIEEEYHTIIFELFRRLHTPEEYPGEGIGLALARKIVESHGGAIRMESAPVAGSRFCFTLPTPKIG